MVRKGPATQRPLWDASEGHTLALGGWARSKGGGAGVEGGEKKGQERGGGAGTRNEQKGELTRKEQESRQREAGR